MKEEHAHDPRGDKGPKPVLRAVDDQDTPVEEKPVEGEEEKGTEKTPFLGKYGKDEIRTPLREEAELALRAAEEPLAEESARTHRYL